MACHYCDLLRAKTGKVFFFANACKKILPIFSAGGENDCFVLPPYPPLPLSRAGGQFRRRCPGTGKRKRKREGIKLRVEMRRSRPRDLWKEQEIANFSRIGTFRLRPKHWSDDRIGTFYNWHVGESRASDRPLTHTLTKKRGAHHFNGPFLPFSFPPR